MLPSLQTGDVNYYRRYVGDYLRDTSRLSMLEHGAYNLLLDYYYADETPICAQLAEVYRMVRAMLPIEQRAVERVLELFFSKAEDGYHHKRVDREIAVAKASIEKQRQSGADSAAKRWNGDGLEDGSTHRSTHTPGNGSTDGSTHDATHAPSIQPPTTNHHPPASNPQKKIEALRSRGSRLSLDWFPSETLTAWAGKTRSDLDLPAVVEKFKDYWRAVPGSKGVKLDWEATFRNFLRNERGTSNAAPDYSAVIAGLKN